MTSGPDHLRAPETIERELEFETAIRGHDFSFTTTWGLFSPRGIDAGTRLLIRHLEVADDATCLDLGCGWGPIGLVMSRLAPAGRVHLVDRDFVAVDYARRNARDNACANCDVYLSNGLCHVPAATRFHTVASNLPAKVGNELLTLVFRDIQEHLEPEGRLYVVTVSGLRSFIRRTFREIFGNYEKVKQSGTHTVSLAVRT